MINVTERAKKELKKLLVATVEHPLARLRLTSGSRDKIGLGIDVELPGDKTVEFEGVTVLLVGQDLAPTLKGITLDVDDTPDGPQLVLSS